MEWQLCYYGLHVDVLDGGDCNMRVQFMFWHMLLKDVHGSVFMAHTLECATSIDLNVWMFGTISWHTHWNLLHVIA